MSIRSLYFVTTPIFYVNAAPHIGHLYSVVLADAAARWAKCKTTSVNVLFSAGTDEHGLKIQRTAFEANKTPEVLCRENSTKFLKLFQDAGISVTSYIRTTQPNHMDAVHCAWNILMERGFIQKGTYSGWYSVADEAFLPEAQTEKRQNLDGTTSVFSVESGHPVEWQEEENYLFKLSHFQQKIRDWVVKEPIKPAIFNQQVLHWLDERQLPDLSVSRSSERLKWAITVPGDEGQKVYVWLDALINYLTVCGFPNEAQVRKWWPADLQVIGKDILKFHAIYWPAFLFGLDLEPPKQILCHSHWVVNHQKMSKSLGNVIDPFDRLNRYSVDGLRYFLLREGVPHSDSNWSDEKIVGYLNAELANTIGNLLARSTSLAVNPRQMFPNRPRSESLKEFSGQRSAEFLLSLQSLPSLVAQQYDQFNFYKGIESIMSALRDANSIFQLAAPWSLAKSELERDKVKLDQILYLSLECLRISGILLSPITPEISKNILTKINCLSECHLNPFEGDRPLCTEQVILFRRIDDVLDDSKKKKKI